MTCSKCGVEHQPVLYSLGVIIVQGMVVGNLDSVCIHCVQEVLDLQRRDYPLSSGKSVQD